MERIKNITKIIVKKDFSVEIEREGQELEIVKIETIQQLRDFLDFIDVNGLKALVVKEF